MLLMLDNYDSFTYNLVQYLSESGEEVKVVRNDQATVEEIDAMRPTRLVISPGPGTPSQAGISIAAIRHFAGKIPVLGVCLGHQSLNEAFGGHTIHAQQIMHGKTSRIHHNQTDLFVTLDNPFVATRYHSLVIDAETMPDCFEVTAWTCTDDGSREEIMGIRHRQHAAFGVQFHPESILTAHGRTLLRNFLKV